MNENGIPAEIREEYAKRIEAFRLLDDTFMSTVFDGQPKATQRMLQIILGRDDIEVERVTAQRRVFNIPNREVVLDIEATERLGNRYDVEVQRDNIGAHPRRARFILSLMDSSSLAKGMDFSGLGENYVIFFTEEDVLKYGLPVYYIERTITNYHNVPFPDGSHIVYVNGAYQPKDGEDSELIRLIHDFHCTRPEDMQIEEIADRVRYYKRTEGGTMVMCRIMEEFGEEQREKGRAEGREEGRAEGREEGKETTWLASIRSLMDNMKLSAEQAMEALNIPREQREKLAAKL